LNRRAQIVLVLVLLHVLEMAWPRSVEDENEKEDEDEDEVQRMRHESDSAHDEHRRDAKSAEILPWLSSLRSSRLCGVVGFIYCVAAPPAE
jgi:hypothetical protein